MPHPLTRKKKIFMIFSEYTLHNGIDDSSFTTYLAHLIYHYPSLCTKILGHIQDADAVQALLRLLLRFTRNHKQAQLFAENNGLHHVMHLKEVLTDSHSVYS